MNEIGRELKASELHAGQIVWLQKPTNPAMASLWVDEVLEDLVLFWAGKAGFTLALMRVGDALYDDTHAMRVFEYLGADQPTRQ